MKEYSEVCKNSFEIEMASIRPAGEKAGGAGSRRYVPVGGIIL
jgi:hypothetical protein